MTISTCERQGNLNNFQGNLNNLSAYDRFHHSSILEKNKRLLNQLIFTETSEQMSEISADDAVIQALY